HRLLRRYNALGRGGPVLVAEPRTWRGARAGGAELGIVIVCSADQEISMNTRDRSASSCGRSRSRPSGQRGWSSLGRVGIMVASGAVWVLGAAAWAPCHGPASLERAVSGA